jgi:hypothetical protein
MYLRRGAATLPRMDLQQQPPTIEQQILWEAQRQTKALQGIHTMLIVLLVLGALAFASAVSSLVGG